MNRNTCDRNSLHDMCKRQAKNTITRFAYDLVIELQKEDANRCSIKQIYDFANKWVDERMSYPEKEDN